jgi:hypothetical protein
MRTFLFWEILSAEGIIEAKNEICYSTGKSKGKRDAENESDAQRGREVDL